MLNHDTVITILWSADLPEEAHTLAAGQQWESPKELIDFLADYARPDEINYLRNTYPD